MVSNITSREFRLKYKDHIGAGLAFSWYIIDYVGYKNNPRKKSLGFHSVLDQTLKSVKNNSNDTFGWHFHTVPKNQNALEYNHTWTNNDWHEQSICRRLLEKKTFSPIFRAGGNIERNDLSFWLENFIPFDFSCLSYRKGKNIYKSAGMSDWRFAPSDWSYYNPDIYDYRKKGKMNRTIFRSLDLDTNSYSIDKNDIESAFKRSLKTNTVLSVSTHDRRNIVPEIEKFMKIFLPIADKYKDKVLWKNMNSLESAKKILNLKSRKQKFTLKKIKNVIFIKSKYELFGPIPFIALKEKNLFYRANPTIEGKNLWAIKLNNGVDQIGVAGSDKHGNVAAINLKIN